MVWAIEHTRRVKVLRVLRSPRQLEVLEKQALRSLLTPPTPLDSSPLRLRRRLHALRLPHPRQLLLVLNLVLPRQFHELRQLRTFPFLLVAVSAFPWRLGFRPFALLIALC